MTIAPAHAALSARPRPRLSTDVIIWAMDVLVTGASGFVGSLLAPRLQQDGMRVRALARSPERARAALATGMDPAALAEVEIHAGDALTGAGLSEALAGVQVAYYLIHSMERTPGPVETFVVRERVAAENFAAAAGAAGVERIVYLGGLLPASPPGDEDALSRHLRSREEVERILLGASPGSVALRASIVIGARSRSFRLMVRLVERMPVLALPAWRRSRTQPIDQRDLIEMLLACAQRPLAVRTLDVGGPDVLSYGEMIARIAELMLVGRPALELGVNLTPIAARVAAAIASEDPDLVLPLMEGLQTDLLPADDNAAKLLGVRLHTFDAAVEHALSEWERAEVLAAR